MTHCYLTREDTRGILVDTQHEDGSWSLQALKCVKILAPNFRMKEESLLDLGAAQGLEDSIIITFLVVATMICHCQENDWMDTAVKATKFLKAGMQEQQQHEILQVFKAFKLPGRVKPFNINDLVTLRSVEEKERE